MQPSIIIFTNTFPYENGETFLETELPYLLALHRPVELVPLYGRGVARPFSFSPETPVTITPPLLPFSPNNRHKLLFYGLFNCAPLFFGVRELFAQKMWRSHRSMWRLATSWLLIRTALYNNKWLFNRLLNDEHPTQTTLYFYWGDKSALLLPFLRKKCKKKNRPFPKTIVRFHGSDLYEEANGIHPFRNLLFPAIDLACPVSQYGSDYLKRHYGALSPPTLVARLGTDDHGLGPNPASDASFHIVTCARLVPLKRLHLIGQALWLLHNKKCLPVPVQWTLIGDGPVRQELEASLHAAALLETLSVHFTGHLPHHSIIDFYRTNPVDLFMLTSESEGVPVSMMEALSFGIPAIATAVGGVPEIITNGAGYLLPPNPTPHEVAQQLLDFMRLSHDQRNTMRQVARAAWEAGWSAEVNFKQFCALV